MGQTTQAFGSSRTRQLPLLGLFRCIYCGQGFGVQRRLNDHYRRAHPHIIPLFESKSLAERTNRWFDDERSS